MDRRAASEVLSFALVFGLVVSAVAIISVSGVGALQDTKDAEQLENAKRAFDVLADNMADLHQRGAPSRATEISLENAQLYTADNVTINVSTRTSSAGWVSVSREVRPIVYEGEKDRKLIYEGGAVFHTTRGGARIDQQPPIVTRGNHVLVPVVQTRSANATSVGGTTVLVRANRRLTNVPIRNDTSDTIQNVAINITSPRHELWREYLEGTAFDNCREGTDANGDAFVTCFAGSSPTRVYVPVSAIDLEIEL